MGRIHPEIYFFGAGVAEGRAEMRNLLGGKGANLAEMARLKLPVPPGFTISTQVCNAQISEGVDRGRRQERRAS
jgi:pyruvate, orthophosphate dikinase